MIGVNLWKPDIDNSWTTFTDLVQRETGDDNASLWVFPDWQTTSTAHQ